MSDGARNRGRMAVYTLAGVYLVYLAYTMFCNLSASSGNERILMIVAMIFFGVVGIAMIVMGTVMGYKLAKRPPQEQPPEIDEAKEESDEKGGNGGDPS